MCRKITYELQTEKSTLLSNLKEMRKDYRLSLLFPGWKSKFHTNYGFCHYSDYKGWKEVVDDIRNIHLEIAGEWFPYGSFWFHTGDIQPRLKLLNEVIKYLEKK